MLQAPYHLGTARPQFAVKGSSLFYDAFSVSKLYSVDDMVISDDK
jgi:hypothetical protein